VLVTRVLAKLGVVAASRVDTNVRAHALATAAVWRTQTMVNELSEIYIRLISLGNTQ